MQITRIEEKDEAVREFRHTQWPKVHPEHFGHEQDVQLWKKRNVEYKATEGDKIIGTMSCKIIAGVLHLDEFIVSDDARGTGVGKALMDELEKDIAELGVHMVYLETGVNWKAREFYKKLGFKEVGKLNNCYEKQDFVILQKDY